MNTINWRDEWTLLVETIKRQDFQHVLEKSHRDDLIVTAKNVAITSIATGMGALIGGLTYGPVGALAGSTTAGVITYGAQLKYKSLYELIKQLSSEERYQLLTNIKAVLGGMFNEQTIILSAVVVAKEIYRFLHEMRQIGPVQYQNQAISSSNNFILFDQEHSE